jgi:hypothetical protein
MDYSEELAARVRGLLAQHAVAETPLLDGKSFWVDDRLVVSVHGEELLIRVADDEYGQLLKRPGARPYEFAERPVPSWVMVGPPAILDDGSLLEWLSIGMRRPSA